jgi:type I restriction enzyme M protein
MWRACDILRRDDNCGGVMAYLEHLAWLLFLRFLDVQEERWAAELAEDYTPVLSEPFRWRSWVHRRGEPDDVLPFVHEQLLPHLQSLSGSPTRDTIRAIFSQRHIVVAASANNLLPVLEIIDNIDFDSDDDVFAVSRVYEELLARMGGENRIAGEFYTPRPLVRFMVDVVDPRLGETVYDPACGSGGFLVQAYQHMLEHAKNLTAAQRERLQQESLFGAEKKAVPALLGLMNGVLHGITSPNLVRQNTLMAAARGDERYYDVILTNPPFGGTENRRVQAHFPVPSSATELLFLQYVMERLTPRDGARCGMVVPEGTLFRGGAFASVRERLLTEFDLHTVVSLPPGAFAPYSDVKTALLFFRRPGPTQEIWTYELPAPEGSDRFNRGAPLEDLHFEPARAAWRAWKQYRWQSGPKPGTTEQSWIVDAGTLASRGFDLTARHPCTSPDPGTSDPVRVVHSMQTTAQQLMDGLVALRELVEALRHASESQPWPWRPLEDPQVAHIIMGQSPPGHSYNDVGEGLPFFQGKADFGAIHPVPSRWCSQPIRIAQPDDVLISVRAPVGPTNLCAETCCIGRGLAALRSGPKMLPRYLLYVLRALEREIRDRGQGSTFAGITKRDLATLRVPVPPLVDQQRLVEHLDGVHSELAWLSAAQARSADELVRLERSVLGQVLPDRD